MARQPKKTARGRRPKMSVPKPGVRESNAGDDFHILWAARQSLQLLNPNNHLKRIFIEKVSPVDGIQPLMNEDYFLGVDLSEYYGGDELNTATRVVVTQLKYSTRHPGQLWTASRLCAARTNAASSVIRRFADVYKGFLHNGSRHEIIEKFTIRLVSNQPADPKLVSALQAAQNVLKASTPSSAGMTTAHLLRKLSARDQKVIRSLQSKSRLKSTEFTDFIRVLDLTGCGEATRAFQRIRLIQELAPSVSNDPTAALRDLRRLIEDEAVPETENSKGLTEHEILASLGVSHKENLLPAPSHLQPTKHLIPTRDAEELAAMIMAAPTGQILAHGNAGVGKTTTVQSIINHLPPGSVVIVYDCYGGGSYLVAGEQRHTNHRAFLHLTNELAIHCGSPFLIRPSRDTADLQRDFRRSLDMATKVVAAQGGILVLAIDAADNAIVAAAASGDKDCFIPPLWTVPFPLHSRLLMTSRSHRRAMLQAPPDVIQHELKGFNLRASTAHLRGLFPHANDASAAIFHSRTGGNPRVQYYLLDRTEAGSTDQASLERLLAVSNRTPDSLFADLLDAAVKHSSDPDKSKQHLSILVCLTRLVPVHVFADACSVSLDEARDFCRALVPGLVLEGDEVSFRDEDFETYLRDRLTQNEMVETHDRLASHFIARANQDPYAAQAVAEHLFQAGRHEELIGLALEGLEPVAIKDQMRRLEIARRRIRLAMQSACLLGNDTEAVRLTLLAAEATRSDGAVTALVRENPELAAIYADTNSIARIYLREENSNWLGAAHLRTAAMYARDPAQRDRAKDHLDAAQAWLRRWVSLPKQESYNWRIDAWDIACGAEAVYWLAGAQKSRDWLKRWRPPSFVMECVRKLGSSLATQVSSEDLDNQFAELGLAPRVAAALLASIWEAGGYPSRQLVEETAGQLVRFAKRRAGRQEDSSKWAVHFCELCASHRLNAGLTMRILQSLCPPFPKTIPHDRADLRPYDLALRTACLRAVISGQRLTSDDLLPEKYRRKEGENEYLQDSERRRFSESIGRILSTYQIRARAIASQTTVADLADEIAKDLKDRRTESEHRWFKSDWQFPLWAERTCDALIACSGNAEPIFEEIATLAERTLKGAAPGLWTNLANALVRHERYRPLAYRLLEQAALNISERPAPGRERWELLLRCSEIASRHDEALGRDYYERALSAAEGIDDDNALLLKLQVGLARRAASSASKDEAHQLASRLANVVEAHEDYVSESSRLPWEETLGAVTRLDPAGGTALCSRWDDEDRLRIGDGIVTFVREGTESGFITPLDGLPLLRLAGEYFDISEEAVPFLQSLFHEGVASRPNLVLAMQTVSAWIERDVPVAARRTAAERIIRWAEENGVSQLAGVAQLRSLVSFAKTLKEEDRDGSLSYRDESSSESRIQELLEEAKCGSLEDLDGRIERVWRLSYRAVGKYLLTIGRSVSPSQRTAYLDALVALKPDPVFADSIIEAFESMLTQWRGSVQVREWAEKGVGAFIENHLPAIMAYDYSAARNLRSVLSVAYLSGKPRAEVVLPAVVKHLEVLGPRTLYAIAESLAGSLADVDVRKVLEWSLTRTERQLVQSGKALAQGKQPPLPEGAPAVLAHLFWSLFGHPEKHIRWCTLHAARGVIRLRRDTAGMEFNRFLLTELIRLLRSTSAGAFRSERLEFYHMSACAWALLLFVRLADEYPEELLPHTWVLAEIATDKDFPHAQIRELARQAALRLTRHGPQALPEDILEQVTLANRPPVFFYPRTNTYGSRYDQLDSEAQRDSHGRRFSFDSLDTLRYWYPSVSEIFGNPPRGLNITSRAEKWVCDRWGRTDKDWWKDPRELGGRYNWQQMSNEQGQVPPIENLRTYLEYHAMFCAAGEMVDEMPVEMRDWGDSECPWEGWVERHIGASPSYWLADLRSPTPYLVDCWGQFPPVEQWLRRDDPSEYDAGLGLGEPGHSGEIVVLGNIDVIGSRRRGGVRVTSALVTPEKALSLLRALETASSPRNFKLPVLDYYESDERGEINKPGFELKAWLKWQRFEDGIDEFDPLSRGVRGSFGTFADDCMRAMKVSIIPGTQSYSLPGGELAARLEIWSDNLEAKHTSESYSEGQRLWLRLDILLEYLQARGLDLIIAVKIARNLERNERGEEDKYDFGRSRIYLLRRDGTLETLAGSRRLR